jgi:hypothetical protein
MVLQFPAEQHPRPPRADNEGPLEGGAAHGGSLGGPALLQDQAGREEVQAELGPPV